MYRLTIVFCRHWQELLCTQSVCVTLQRQELSWSLAMPCLHLGAISANGWHMVTYCTEQVRNCLAQTKLQRHFSNIARWMPWPSIYVPQYVHVCTGQNAFCIFLLSVIICMADCIVDAEHSWTLHIWVMTITRNMTFDHSSIISSCVPLTNLVQNYQGIQTNATWSSVSVITGRDSSRETQVQKQSLPPGLRWCRGNMMKYDEQNMKYFKYFIQIWWNMMKYALSRVVWEDTEGL